MRLWRSMINGRLAIFLILVTTPNAWAMCGFYIYKADTTLYNERNRKTPSTRFEQEVQTLAKLTEWNLVTIRRKINVQPGWQRWWNRLSFEQKMAS